MASEPVPQFRALGGTKRKASQVPLAAPGAEEAAPSAPTYLPPNKRHEHHFKEETRQETPPHLLYTMDANPLTGIPPDAPSIPVADAVPPGVPAHPALGPPTSTEEVVDQEILADVKQQGKDRNEERTSKNGTQSGYKRHFNEYKSWWEGDQHRRQSEAIRGGRVFVPTPELPITPVKAALYLDYASKRPLIGPNKQPIPNTVLSASSIEQIINSLEYYRFIESGTKANKLRDHILIQNLVKAVRENESKRQRDTQHLKATGAKSQTFSRKELHDIALGLLKEPGTEQQLWLRSRDRGMLLTSTSTAMRGDNVRPLLLSDLLLHEVPLINMGMEHKETVLVIMSNQGKTNRNGRIDFHGAFRHRRPELCAVGAVALHLFSQFHIANHHKPDFSPDFDSLRATDIGFRSWYELLLFPSKNSPTEALSPQAHRDRFNAIKVDFDVVCEKVTHTGRMRGAVDGIEFGATVADVKSLGLWSQGGSVGPRRLGAVLTRYRPESCRERTPLVNKRATGVRRGRKLRDCDLRRAQVSEEMRM